MLCFLPRHPATCTSELLLQHGLGYCPHSLLSWIVPPTRHLTLHPKPSNPGSRIHTPLASSELSTLMSCIPCSQLYPAFLSSDHEPGLPITLICEAVWRTGIPRVQRGESCHEDRGEEPHGMIDLSEGVDWSQRARRCSLRSHCAILSFGSSSTRL